MSDLYENFDQNLYKLKPEGSSVTPSQTDSGVAVEDTNQYVGSLISGKQGFTNNESGYILGVDKGVPKFYIGNTTDYLNWDGEALTVKGTFNIGGTTITIDNTKSIQTYLDTINTAGGGTLYLQNGTYTLTADISIPSGVTLEGVSRDGVIIDCNASYAVKIVGTNVYTTGTVAISDTQTTVVGTGTTFTSAMVGRYIYLDGLWFEITVFTDTTHITIGNAYTGSNLSGYAYAIADVNFNPIIRKLTIKGATGAGFIVSYANEPWIDDLVIIDNGTGMDLDYVVFPKIFVLSESNGVNLNMNYVSGFKIDYCSFGFSTTGAGVVMTNVITSTFFDTAVDQCTGDGINVTDCRGIAFLSASFSSNGGQGIEFVSGVNDCQIIAVLTDGNASDGIKLTATSDRNTIVASSITNNGGYGINIAASTCDNNQIIAPAFNANTSGNINNLGTGTFISPEEVFVVQNIALFTGIDTYTDLKMRASNDGELLFIAVTLSSTTTIFRMIKNTSGNYHKTHSVTVNSISNTTNDLTILGDYVYYNFIHSTGSTNTLQRFDKADLANSTAMTFSGTSRTGLMWTNGTDLFIQNVDNFDRFTISGTTATNAATVSFTSFGASRGVLTNANHLYSYTPDNIKKWDFTGGAALSTTAFIEPLYTVDPQTTTPRIFLGNEATVGISWLYQNYGSGTTVLGTKISIMGTRLP